MNNQTISIKTLLVNKEEEFRILALGLVTGLPVLFTGEPGTAKTQSSIDFTKAIGGEYYLNQLSFGTRPSEIKGIIDMGALTKGEYRVVSPIADAMTIIIDEVEKGTTEIRNTLLSILRERKLLLGTEERECRWKLFVGTCNILPPDETGSPFWDRFVIKHTVSRLENTQVQKMWVTGEHTVTLTLQEAEEPNTALLEKFSQIIYKNTTDRTLSYLPELIEGIKVVWDVSDVEAIIKAANFISPSQAAAVSSGLLSADEHAILNQMNLAKNSTDPSVLSMAIQAGATFLKNNKATPLKKALKRECATIIVQRENIAVIKKRSSISQETADHIKYLTDTLEMQDLLQVERAKFAGAIKGEAQKEEAL